MGPFLWFLDFHFLISFFQFSLNTYDSPNFLFPFFTFHISVSFDLLI
ncbi:hypothetical protein LEP1GSC202_3896 [Leptospira yanagawae serovar Saopaulo str. Sao Paulo = ATCC 700523]|uniref:Uncharacterized protein n=1 Tax=Leptospira yanagawae serovar Saopaulo str. Sao Paulo = ATCC 700523 TaxID=1249483 RepID=A0A5E8HIL9_9LEPT|nr:hypothetical protein LEP1GSC202_3896 [Leptospira yanagawae serovar Saopaulo str. Sao Paulo = ATCC 700523]